MARDWTQDEVIKDLELVIEKQDKEIERLREELRRIAFKANIRRNIKEPLPIKTFLRQSDLQDYEIWMLVESLADIAIVALKEGE
jgi:hypothetical protein